MSLAESVSLARRPEVVREVRAVYADMEREIGERKPKCSASGRCCNFEGYGHRLYVTTVELAAFLEEWPGVAGRVAAGVAGGRKAALLPVVGSCPLLESGRCSVHEIRPFGCRIFFCDPDAEDWMKEAYERYLTRLKGVHEAWGVPYHYVEWRGALKELGLGL